MHNQVPCMVANDWIGFAFCRCYMIHVSSINIRTLTVQLISTVTSQRSSKYQHTVGMVCKITMACRDQLDTSSVASGETPPEKIVSSDWTVLLKRMQQSFSAYRHPLHELTGPKPMKIWQELTRFSISYLEWRASLCTLQIVFDDHS
jgi:hypothetical protein